MNLPRLYQQTNIPSHIPGLRTKTHARHRQAKLELQHAEKMMSQKSEQLSSKYFLNDKYPEFYAYFHGVTLGYYQQVFQISKRSLANCASIVKTKQLVTKT